MSSKHFDGKPCVKCGSTLRYIKSRACVACDNARSAKRRAEKPGEAAAYMAEWLLENRGRKNDGTREWTRRNKDRHRVNSAEWKAKNREKARRYNRASHLKTHYSLSLGQYEEMAESQGGTCAICAEKCKRGLLSVDHCHDTGAVRGLLCDMCNNALGKMRDNPALLRAAADYLERHNHAQ